uniref:Uncharacterized protein n=1 Tax=Palpitomonas bilix TaxID=652834 RepID=A0A7S3D758_9EUKA|mmetsp:Transcript_25216/g.63275  ORF Transcript_25216/g.63275 Transcript_25216/m.63275 type:complete len:135 (+) Transcript_25216:340-744(+)|eukprot:CAMPEP_0113892998 /NCGR_PEP_ID=MMETSP0780_2-20120614/15790_1 /TAXON_ID=652834 /ORGANISM="Palpitomonas bilix" /LENGTH=134 /DNA_ID=CAMNT_0000883123 /DNA_START=286 /DNA_END=690 /DNA_ORIENTATION=+ /assembly_acc=CAM_ASM_000599
MSEATLRLPLVAMGRTNFVAAQKNPKRGRQYLVRKEESEFQARVAPEASSKRTKKDLYKAEEYDSKTKRESHERGSGTGGHASAGDRDGLYLSPTRRSTQPSHRRPVSSSQSFDLSTEDSSSKSISIASGSKNQ